MNMKWEFRPCSDCQLQLGCPHSKYAGKFIAGATKEAKAVILKEFCSKNRISGDTSSEDETELQEDV